MTRRLFTDQQEQEMADLFRGGMPACDVARKFGARRHQIAKALKRHNLEPWTLMHLATLKPNPERDAIVISHYEGGSSIRGAADKAGIGPTLCRDILERNGKLRRDKGPKDMPTEMSQKVVAQYKRGVTQRDICKEFGLSPPVVKKALLMAGCIIRKPIKERHYQWGGGRWVMLGYVYVRVYPDDPLFCMVNSSFMCAEHRLVMARHIGRPLTGHETVHHKNGVRDDNRLENLQLRIGKHGKGSAFRCGDCGSCNIVPDELG